MITDHARQVDATMSIGALSVSLEPHAEESPRGPRGVHSSSTFRLPGNLQPSFSSLRARIPPTAQLGRQRQRQRQQHERASGSGGDTSERRAFSAAGCSRPPLLPPSRERVPALAPAQLCPPPPPIPGGDGGGAAGG
ncbi:hypothetical protein VPH35_040308 [Triticum aestivum]